MDTAIPLGRTAGIESASRAEERHAGAARERVRDHNTIWGPFVATCTRTCGVLGQGRAMRERTDSHWVIHGRAENATIHDEIGMRHFYANGAAEWPSCQRPASRDRSGGRLIQNLDTRWRTP